MLASVFANVQTDVILKSTEVAASRTETTLVVIVCDSIRRKGTARAVLVTGIASSGVSTTSASRKD